MPMEGGLTLVTDVVKTDGPRDKGRYLTLKLPHCAPWDDRVCAAMVIALRNILAQNNLTPKRTLVVGLGNRQILCDRLGAATVDRLLPEEGLYLLCPDVQTHTGLSTADVVAAVAHVVQPDLVLTVDALVCNLPQHLMCTIQLWDAGFRPGGGVGKTSKPLNRETLKAPVVSVGVPMLSFVQPYDPLLCVTTQDIEEKQAAISATLSAAIRQVFGKEKENE